MATLAQPFDFGAGAADTGVSDGGVVSMIVSPTKKRLRFPYSAVLVVGWQLRCHFPRVTAHKLPPSRPHYSRIDESGKGSLESAKEEKDRQGLSF